MRTVTTVQPDLFTAFRMWLAARRTDRELSRLSDTQLADIGLQRGQIPGLAWELASATVVADADQPKLEMADARPISVGAAANSNRQGVLDRVA